jgi:hypothetical protein
MNSVELSRTLLPNESDFASLRVKETEHFLCIVKDPLLAFLSIDSFRLGLGSYSFSKSFSKRICPVRCFSDLMRTEFRMYGKQAERLLL